MLWYNNCNSNHDLGIRVYQKSAYAVTWGLYFTKNDYTSRRFGHEKALIVGLNNANRGVR